MMDIRGDYGLHSRRRDAIPRYKDAGIPRAASYTYVKGLGYLTPSVVTITGDLSESDSLTPLDESQDSSSAHSSGHTTPDEVLEVLTPQSFNGVQLRKVSSLTSCRSSKEPDAEGSSLDSSVERTSLASLDSSGTISTAATSSNLTRPRLSLNSSHSRLTRRSWYNSTPSTASNSRSPSPIKAEPAEEVDATSGLGESPTKPVLAHSRKRSLVRNRSFKFIKDGFSSAKEMSPAQALSTLPEIPSRRASLLKIKSRPMSSLFRSSSRATRPTTADTASLADWTPSLPTSFSTERVPVYGLPLVERATPMPRLLSADRVPTMSTLAKKRDDLWGVFRSLDGDFAKFSAKSTSLKANLVRSSLLPFLQAYATHPSNDKLRLEDLDRRANILNKWWIGLIDMLQGRNNQLVSGMDRPAILDGLIGIMQRCEWRISLSPFCAPQDFERLGSTPSSRSSSAPSNTALGDSVHQNVRNIFIQNLTSQMTVVVDKMSMKHAPASLVTFCGNTCAYAFIFVPGMADVLIRLWDTQLSVLQRVLGHAGVTKFDDLASSTERVVAGFPSTLHPLGFSSLGKFVRKMRKSPPLPPGTAHIDWRGNWLDRWSGRESDLFYAFVRSFYNLAAEFLPPACTQKDRLCAPGMLAVQAQILANLDATMHRDASSTQQGPTPADSASTFDNILADVDAVASALPIPPTNATRVMAENRLIMLVRDFLSRRDTTHVAAQRIFAETFNSLLQVAARGISIFDHAASYTLLEFLEEALTILIRYEAKHSHETLVDWDFWQLVCKKIVSSHNTVTEIRLYSFLYTIWNTLAADSNRRTDLCLNFLLDADVFDASFNHWCPMVRAYYMRLLCWRVGRFDGKEKLGDELVFETLLGRLQTCWGHHLYLNEQAMTQQTTLPTSSACNPAPGRRLVIVRTDTQSRGGRLSSFESLLATGPVDTSVDVAMDDYGSRPSTADSMSDSEASDGHEKGFGGLVRRVIASMPRDLLRSSVSHAQGRSPYKHTPYAATRERVVLTDGAFSAVPRPQHHFYFKFSLEYYSPQFTNLDASRLQAPRLPLAAQLFLQTRSARARAVTSVMPAEPTGISRDRARYAGRALAEWNLIVGECHAFFERRKHEGVMGNRYVETPTLGVEAFRRPT